MATLTATTMWPASRACPLTATTIIGEFTLEQMVAFLWRVRRWKMIVNVEWDIDGTGEFYTAANYENEQTPTGNFGEPIESELDLVCQSPQFFMFNFVQTDVGFINSTLDATRIVTKKIGAEVYSTINGFSLSPPNSFFVSSDPFLSNKIDAGSVSIEFADYVVTFPLFYNWLAGSSPPPSGAYLNCNATLLAQEYWPYES